MQNKKVAAALAAVQLYLQQEEAEAAEAAGLVAAASAPRNMQETLVHTEMLWRPTGFSSNME